MIIFGLGNKGEDYNNTRHNIGRDSVKYCADLMCDFDWVFDKYSNVYYKECSANLIFALPEVYMNVSGESVEKALETFSFLPEQMIVVHDDIAFEFGEVKISLGKSSGGHNGVQSIIDRLKTDEFIRIRIGIGSPDKELKEYVLSKFTEAQKELIPQIYDKVCKTISLIREEGVYKAMNELNK